MRNKNNEYKKSYEIIDNIEDEKIKVILLYGIKNYIENINDENKEKIGQGWIRGQLAMAKIQEYISEDERKTIEAEICAERMLQNPPKAKPKKKNDNELHWKDIVMFVIFVILGTGFGFYLHTIISTFI